MTTDAIEVEAKRSVGWGRVVGVGTLGLVASSMAVYAVPAVLRSRGLGVRATTTGLFAGIAVAELVMWAVVGRWVQRRGPEAPSWGFHREVPALAYALAVGLGLVWAAMGLAFASQAAPGTVSAFAAWHGLGAPAVLPLGLALGWLYVTVGRRSLVPGLLCHVLINLIMEPWFFLAWITAARRG